MKIFNKWKAFEIKYDSNEYFIDRGESDCDMDLFMHIIASSKQLWLDVCRIEEMSKKDVTEDTKEKIREEELSEEQIEEEIKKIRDKDTKSKGKKK